MTFGSLFAGIGGLDLGLERAGLHCVWQVEIDAYARRVLAKHWPDVRRHDDVKTFPPQEGDWQCDLICGGFPCQDVSNAGKRVGIDGERSGLWGEFSRIVRVLRPRYVLVENVAALLVRGLDRVLGDLAESGYDAEWDCIPAAAVGAPHLRWRVFLLAYSQGDGLCGNGRRRAEQERRHETMERLQQPGEPGVCGTSADSLRIGRGEGRTESEAWRWQRHALLSGGQDVSDSERDGVWLPGRGPTLGAAQGVPGEARRQRLRTDSQSAHGCHVPDAASGFAGQRWREQFEAYCQAARNLYWPQAESPVCGVVDGVPHRVDRLTGLGNAVVPQIAEWLGKCILEADFGIAESILVPRRR